MASLRSSLIVLLAIFGSSSALAGSLGNYKNQSMGSHAKVSDESCPDDYKKDCKAKCSQSDSSCVNSCDLNAASFCEDREHRRHMKELELVAKGASLGAGAAAMLFDDKMQNVSVDGTVAISDYAQIWNRASIVSHFGGGLLQGGTKLAQIAANFRYSWIGFSANADYMFDDTDKLAELDYGPTFNMGTSHMVVAFQPSVLTRAGNGFKPIWGGGLRALNTFYYERTYIEFDPLLGYINQQWAYDLKLAVGYRVTPAVSVDVGYSHRDILDLNDLNISETGLNGAFVRLGVRMN